MADEAQLDAIARANAFAVYNGITTHQTGDGTAEAILEIGPDSLNPYGLLHGGAYYTLADCAAGSAWQWRRIQMECLSSRIMRQTVIFPFWREKAMNMIRRRVMSTRIMDYDFSGMHSKKKIQEEKGDDLC